MNRTDLHKIKHRDAKTQSFHKFSAPLCLCVQFTYKINTLLLAVGLLFSAFSCKTNNSKQVNAEEKIATVPTFNPDSAYLYIEKQADFGPRVPNTPEHVACGEYLANKLAEHGATVANQYADLTAFDGTVLKARNIIGSYNPESKKRVLLFAHWDSRPWADYDPNEKNHHKPILGVNDGASGVGVLLEIARHINKQAPAVGVDIIFFDAEDYGAPSFYKGVKKDEFWCLGSQYWAKNPHVEGYKASFGILLDMVGGKGAMFRKESVSERYASHINQKVWNKAKELGYNQFFLNERGGYVTDDHVPVNEIAKIPSIDIIPCPNDPEIRFFEHWHTVNDTMENIDKYTLKAVGQTVMEVIYNEK
ncbi:M28 family peptidase [Bacteroides sp. 224]|uniref:M20 family metallopeptidase n=1 Tax=Bacteroides sp. 224 TaxID=2302936 RepID=UPI0013D12A5A|nr:M28 family peptidase [Bacteroides sp. 224]NDV63758.1 glutamine cyclotransferase [Bacteroides sp. 224]